MSLTFRVVYDGEVLRPQEPVDLERGRWYRATIEAVAEELASPEPATHEPGVLDDLRRFAIDTGIDDFAEQHHHYLHGSPKK